MGRGLWVVVVGCGLWVVGVVGSWGRGGNSDIPCRLLFLAPSVGWVGDRPYGYVHNIIRHAKCTVTTKDRFGQCEVPRPRPRPRSCFPISSIFPLDHFFPNATGTLETIKSNCSSGHVACGKY